MIDPDAVVWKEPATARGTILLLHGYGSNERELFMKVASVLPDFALASLRGLVTEGPGYGWVSLRRSLTEIGPAALSATADQVSAAVITWLDAAELKKPLGLLGVSQGGVLAMQLLRLAPERFSFVVNLSGYVLAGQSAGDGLLEKTCPPVFWGRGSRDQLVPTHDIERTADWLSRHTTSTIRTYDIGHGETDAEFDDAATFVRTFL